MAVRGRDHRTLTVTIHQEDNKRKATGSLFLSKIIVKLEITLSTVYQNMDLTQNPHKQLDNKQRINNNSNTA